MNKVTLLSFISSLVIGAVIGFSSSIKKAEAQYCLAPGAIAARCGCYGNAFPGETVMFSMCCNGTATAVACNGYCPLGGAPWTAVCN
jgi:hypothetical protein